MQRQKRILGPVVAAAIVAIAYFSFHGKTITVDVSSLHVSDSIELRPGPTNKTIFIFEQPDCLFCEKLAPEIAKLTSTRVLVLPLAAHGKLEKAIANNAWCASDRASAWRAVISQKDIPPATCDSTAVERNLVLAKKIGVTGTPAIVFPDGELVVGFMSAEKIQAKTDDK